MLSVYPLPTHASAITLGRWCVKYREFLRRRRVGVGDCAVRARCCVCLLVDVDCIKRTKHHVTCCSVSLLYCLIRECTVKLTLQLTSMGMLIIIIIIIIIIRFVKRQNVKRLPWR